MAKELRKRDKLEWDSSGGRSTVTVVRKLTTPMSINGEEGKRAAHKPQALRRDFAFNVGKLLSASFYVPGANSSHPAEPLGSGGKRQKWSPARRL